jgi:hypothetical protein
MLAFAYEYLLMGENLLQNSLFFVLGYSMKAIAQLRIHQFALFLL